MSKKLYEEENIQDIADAIREKNSSQNTYTVSQMGNAVRAIHTDPVLEALSVTENGNYLPSAGKDGFSSVSVNIEGSGEAVVQPLTVTQNGTYNPPSGVDGYSPVIVNVSGGSSDNDLLFHFDSNFRNSGSFPSVFNNITGLEISNEQSKFGGNSLKCGTTQTRDNVTCDLSFAFGSSDFTLDFWVYPTNLSSHGIVPLSFTYKSIGIYLMPSKISFAMSKDGSYWYNDRDVSVEMENNAWYHIALVRSGSDIYGFVNGVKVETINVGTDALAQVETLTVGSNTYSNGDRRFAGYIDELRLKIGTAIWTEDFTPPAEPYI